MKRFLLPLLFLGASASAAIKKEDVNVLQLKNGMKVLLLKDSSIPNANMYTFWRVGSRNEVPGITGLSHFFEHMMFLGSLHYPAGSFDKVMEAAGGSNNAYTTNDVTVYTNWFPVSAFETIVDLEADRIASLQFDDKSIASERGVVLSERSTGLENNPEEELLDSLRSVAFEAHPYSWPVIGWESDIKAWTKEDLRRYFETYYNPANAVMVIVGDISVPDITKLLQSKIEVIARQGQVPPVRTVEPPQIGERRISVVKPATSNPHLVMAYKIPETKHADTFALNLITTILSEGPSSRLRKQLIDEKRLAIDLGIWERQGFDPDLYSIYVLGHEDKTLPQLEKAVNDEIELLKQKGVSERELEKAKNKYLVGFYRGLETINGKASLLGNFEVFYGGWEKLLTAPDQYKKVTTADIKRVANTYFKRQTRTVGYLDNKEEVKK